MSRVRGLDGLRGLALLGVLLFHADGLLPGGYLGVDLFFVLSGFLITSLLLAELEATTRIDLAAFWVRRARRLFPALLSLMPAVALYAWLFATPTEMWEIRRDAIATLGYVANWRAIYAHKSYWEMFSSPSPLEHTWSLSIEEQFYVVWPLVVMALGRTRKPRDAALVTSLVLGVASMVAMFWYGTQGDSMRAYFGTDTRATSILAGAALATMLSPSTVLPRSVTSVLNAAGVLALLGVATAWWLLDGASPWLYRGGFWLTELGALVLVACSVAGGLVSRVLSWSPLVALGTVSYGAYLWHWPIDIALTPERTHLHGAPLYGLQLGVTLVIAAASYRFLERPIRTHGVPFARPAIVLPASVAVAVALVVRATHAARPPAPPHITAHADLTDVPPLDGGAPFRVLVVGDSTASSLGWTLRGLREPGLVVDIEGKDSCSMFGDGCNADRWATLTNAEHPQATLVFVGGAFLYERMVDGRVRHACDPSWDTMLEDTMRSRVADLRGPDTRVWLVTVPYPLGPYDRQSWRDTVDCINASLRRASASSGVGVLDLAARVCPRGECERTHDGAKVRSDGVHFDIDGSAEIARWVLNAVR